MIAKNTIPFLISLILIVITGCEYEITSGRLTIGITDDPFPIEIIDEASINIFRVEAHPMDADEDAEMILLSEDTATYNLINLRNGVVETLVDTEIQSGEYDYLRLYVDYATLSIIDGDTYSVKVPSGSTSGIKVKVDPSIKVEEGLTAELVLDFDLTQSFVLNGSLYTPAGIKGFNFKPVIRAFNISETGRVEGIVRDSDRNPIKDVHLWIEIDNMTISTFSDSNGFYSLLGVPTGIHTLFADKEGYVSVKEDNVVIIEGNKTTRDLTLSR